MFDSSPGPLSPPQIPYCLQLFKERPVWTKAGLQVNIEATYRQYIKFLLPMVAFYFTNGAWKSLWCKLGYDPRTVPASKVYQTVDFRIRKCESSSWFCFLSLFNIVEVAGASSICSGLTMIFVT